MRRLAVALTLVWACGCEDTPLELLDMVSEPGTVDDQLAIHGQFCLSPPADVSFPVKVMFIVDGSGSQQFTDQNRQRVVAVEQAVNALIGQPNIYFKIIVFNASITATPGTTDSPVFTNDLETLRTGLTDLAQADTVTDYQGALGVAYAELLRDMMAVQASSTGGNAELGRTKYVLIFVSDGMPDPMCQAGLGNDFDPNFPGGVNLLCEDQTYLDCLLEAPGTTCADGICEYNGMRCYQVPDAATFLGGLNSTELAAGLDYNQPYQILSKVQAITDLAERFEVGALELDTALVLDPQADPGVIAIFGDPRQAIPLMQEMAAEGGGGYLEFYGGDDIDFLEINYDSLAQPRTLRSFFADNPAARPLANGLTSDSDFDGLTDDEEIAAGTDPFAADTDGDGYGDLLEWRERGFAFDARDPLLPPVDAADCSPERRFLDGDGDGLRDCEELWLGSSPSSPDTDRDGIPDGVELANGLDPTRADSGDDLDFDGLENGREIEWHLSPRAPQGEAAARDHYRYERAEAAPTADGRPCYDFAVRHLRLVATRQNEAIDAQAVGYNDVRLYVVESVADNAAAPPLVRTACVRARYVPPTLKAPAQGDVALTDADFDYLFSEDPLFNDPSTLSRLFDPATDCRSVP